MIGKYIIAVVIILAAFAAWVAVQHFARVFAARHPELGPAREEGEGCGVSCGCSVRERIICKHRPENSKQSNRNVHSET